MVFVIGKVTAVLFRPDLPRDSVTRRSRPQPFAAVRGARGPWPCRGTRAPLPLRPAPFPPSGVQKSLTGRLAAEVRWDFLLRGGRRELQIANVLQVEGPLSPDQFAHEKDIIPLKCIVFISFYF